MTWTKRKELYNKSLGILFTAESKKAEPIWRVHGRDHSGSTEIHLGKNCPEEGAGA